MPLHADDEMVSSHCRLDCLGDLVRGRSRYDAKAVPQHRDCLVMTRIYGQMQRAALGRLRLLAGKQPGEPRGWRDIYGMRYADAGSRRMAHPDDVDMLMQGAAAEDIERLHPIADRQKRRTRCEDVFEQKPVAPLARVVGRSAGWFPDMAIPFRVDVGKIAWQEDAVTGPGERPQIPAALQ